MSLTLDVNFELYPLTTGDKFTLLLASSLHGPTPEESSGAKGGMDVDEKPKEDRREAWRGGDQGLAADYDYVTFGKVSDWRLGWGNDESRMAGRRDWERREEGDEERGGGGVSYRREAKLESYLYGSVTQRYETDMYCCYSRSPDLQVRGRRRSR
jgi:hypothetical protein